LRGGIESETESSFNHPMIGIDKLTSADVGKWIVYSILPPCRDRGRLKSWTKQFVYVVFRCGGNWADYTDYTAAPTLPEYLDFLSPTVSEKLALYGCTAALSGREHLTLLVGKEEIALAFIRHFGSIKALSRASLYQLRQFLPAVKPRR
jgi:hypothetical protein